MKRINSIIFAVAIVIASGLAQTKDDALNPLNVSCDQVRTFSLDADTDTLQRDNNYPVYAFRFPDAYGDDLRNQRFEAPADGVIRGVLFVFPTRNFSQWTTGSPDLITKIWASGPDLLPVADDVWISDTTAYADILPFIFSLDSSWREDSTQFVYVDLTGYGLGVEANTMFHAGYTALLNDGDSLAILSDGGSGETDYASEWYNGRFVLMREGWRGVNFFIRVVMETGTDDVRILNPGSAVREPSLHPAYPNPFNARTVVSFELSQSGPVQLSVYDLLGRERAVLLDDFRAAGYHETSVDADGWSSGIYFIRLKTASTTEVSRIVLEK